MEMTVEQTQHKVPVTILKLSGDLDGSNYQAVIAKGKEIQANGAQYLLLDMSEVPFMGSAGLVALHSIALAMQGKASPNPEQGWSALHTIGLDVTQGKQPYVKIYNPQASVRRSLERTGMTDFFEVHDTLEAALASFG